MIVPEEYKRQEFLPLMKCLVELFKPHTYVELGIQRGYTFNAISPLVQRAVGVDIELGLYQPLPENKRPPKLHVYEMATIEFIRRWRDPIDLLFIDADHKAEAVKRDFVGMLPYVKPGTGLILLHDTHPVREELLRSYYCHNAWEAAVDLRCMFSDIVEMVTLPGPWAGLSILRKLGKHHLAWRG